MWFPIDQPDYQEAHPEEAEVLRAIQDMWLGMRPEPIDGSYPERFDRLPASFARNASAVSYHFGGRAQMLRAVLDHHQGPIDAQRRRLLADPDLPGTPLERLAVVTVDPLIDHLGASRGPEYLRIRAELLGRGDLDAEIEAAPLIVEAAGPIDLGSVARFAHHQRELVAAMIFAGLADFARRYPDAGWEERRHYGEFLRAAMVAIGQLAPSVATP